MKSGMDLAHTAKRILAIECVHPIRIAIDGFCAAGKTTLADALAVELRTAGRVVIRVCADDFQNPPEVRWQLGHRSPVGFLRHQFDFHALRSLLLEPLGPAGSLRFHTSCYDVHASRSSLSSQNVADPRSIVLVDGIFLHTPVLNDCFELTILVNTDIETCLRRALARNQERASDPKDLSALYREKYIPGFQLYLEEVAPHQRANIVVEMLDFADRRTTSST